MSERTVPRVECALCGEPFDPTDAGGWCTNDDCGEWQYETYADYDATEDAGAEPAPAESGGDAADESGGDATEESGGEAADESDGEAADESDGEAAEEPGGDVADEQGSGVAEESVDAATDADTTIEENADEQAVELDSCPECGADADPSHRFCTGCGTDLEEVRASIAAVTTCPACEADVAEADRYCTACGTDLRVAAGDEGEDEDGPPEALSLEAYGRSIVVEPGGTVGREIRSLLSDAGRPDDEAVRVHREHVRLVREEGTFFLVDLGENPTAVNGESLEKGDRVPIEPGDELSLSEVVTLTVGAKNA